MESAQKQPSIHKKHHNKDLDARIKGEMPWSYAREEKKIRGKMTEGCKQVMTGNTEAFFRSNLQRHCIKRVRQVEAAGLLRFSWGCRVGRRRRCVRMNSPH